MVVLVSVGTFYFDNSKSVIENQYLDNFDNSVQQLDTSISEFLLTFENALQMFSQNDMVRSLPEEADTSLLQVEQMFRAFQESYPYSAYAYYVFKQPMEDGRFMVTWPDTSAQLKASDYEPESRPWYIGALLSSGESTWSDPYADATTGKLMVTVSRTVESDADTFKGVMAIDVFLDELTNKVENFKSFNHGSAFIVKSSPEGYVFITKDEAFSDILNASWMDQIEDRASGVIEINHKDEPYYLAFRTNEITGWKILGIVEKDRIYAETMNVLKDVLLSTVVILGIGILSMTYISRQLTNSVKDIGHMIQQSPEKSAEKPSPLSMEFERVSAESEDRDFEAPRTTLNMLFDSETEMAKVRDLISKSEEVGLSGSEYDEIEEMCVKLRALRDELIQVSSARRQLQADEIDKLLYKIEDMNRA